MIIFFFNGGMLVLLGSIALLVLAAGASVLGKWILAHITAVCICFTLIYSIHVISTGRTIGRNTGHFITGMICSFLRGLCTLSIMYLELKEMVFENPNPGSDAFSDCLITCLFLFGCEWTWNKIGVERTDGIGPVLLVTIAYLALTGFLIAST